MKGFVFLLIISGLFYSCKTEESGMDVSVVGFVRLYDTIGFLTPIKAGVKVHARNTNKEVHTDENGRFFIQGLKAGEEYTFEFEKDDFGLQITPRLRFIGDEKPGLIEYVNMFQVPDIQISSVTCVKENGYIHMTGKMTPYRTFSIWAFMNDSIDPTNEHYDVKSVHETLYGGGRGEFDIYIYLDGLSYPSGTTYFISIYFHNAYEEPVWDYQHNQYRYSSMVKVGEVSITD
ncbi:MAG: carboxypeptidase-like regulatory domain-containing protein [Bacteroidales bacterium]